MSLHKILNKQIQKYLVAKGIPLDNLHEFISVINDSYLANERDIELSEHSFQINEQELLDNNKILLEEMAMRKASMLQLREAIETLQTSEKIHLDIDEQNLLQLAEYLKLQIEFRKRIEQELIKAKEIAEEASLAKSDFLSIMSHELRTPLNAVIGMTYLLLQNNPLPSQLENLKTLKFSAENLLVLINDILDYNKIESGKIEFEELDFDLFQLIQNIKSALQIKTQDNGNQINIVWESEVPKYIVGDSVRIGQIITNLVTNAVKFTKDGFITITVSLIKSDEHQAYLYFEIKDTGIGIPKEYQRKIFDRFSQADKTTSRLFGGTGLGLCITQRLLELMNSYVYLESEPGVGSSFSFKLMVKVSEKDSIIILKQDELFSSSENQMSLAGIKILVAEDNQMNILVVDQFLKGWNAETIYASNGAEAITLLKSNEFDIVLMDLQMPVMDGYTATEEIRKFNNFIPIIALTASAMLDIRDRAFQVGVNDYVTKPFNPTELYTKIKRRIKN